MGKYVRVYIDDDDLECECDCEERNRETQNLIEDAIDRIKFLFLQRPSLVVLQDQVLSELESLLEKPKAKAKPRLTTVEFIRGQS